MKPGGPQERALQVDLLVVGGGINGAGIARDAAGRGLTVALCERGDFASGTSSRSSKLVHGGLRYLEHGEFRLVREALGEREVLLSIAPHLVRPMRFVLLHQRGMRPFWMLRLGLYVYDHLSRRNRLPASRALALHGEVMGEPLRPEIARAFCYSDCWVDDARLVIANLRAARDLGAQVLARTELVGARPLGNRWAAELRTAAGQDMRIHARALVNAAGPWLQDVIARSGRGGSRARVRLVKGSHIVVHKFWQGEHGYVVQNPDRRIVFVVPFEERFALIGTTDVEYSGNPADVAIGADEIAYLCASVQRCFRAQVDPDRIVHSYSGIRPLYEDESADPAAVTRDYVLDLHSGEGQAPVLDIYGGKITTYRRLAEHAVDRLAPLLDNRHPAWTATTVLPGGAIAGIDACSGELAHDRPWLEPALAHQYAMRYGSLAHELLAGASSRDDLGRCFGALFFEREARYLVAQEWAAQADDILWRRTKHGLALDAAGRQAFRDWFAANGVQASTASATMGR